MTSEPATHGLACPRPGTATFHKMWFVGLHSMGGLESLMLLPAGPRQHDQSAPLSCPSPAASVRNSDQLAGVQHRANIAIPVVDRTVAPLRLIDISDKPMLEL